MSLLNEKQLGTVQQRCEYDGHDNPVSCDLSIKDESVKPAIERKFTIKNSIDYY